MTTAKADMPAASAGNISVFDLMWKYARPYWKSISAAVVLGLVGSTLASVMPLILAPILDLAVGRKPLLPQSSGALSFFQYDLNNIGQLIVNMFGADQDSSIRVIIFLSVVFFVVSLVSNLVLFVSQLIGRSIQARTARDLQNTLFAHIISLPLSFFYQQRSGELISCVARDTSATTSGMDRIVRYCIVAPLQILFYGYMLVKTNVSLALIAICSAAIHYGITKLLSRSVRRTIVTQYSVFGDQSVVTQEAIQGIRLVKSFAAEGFEIRKFRNVSARLVKASVLQHFYENVQDPLRSLTNQLVLLIVLVFAAFELLQGRMEPTGFLLFVYIGQRLVGSIKLMGDVIAMVQVTSASAEKIVSLLKLRPALKDGRDEIASFSTSLKLDMLSFSYGDAPALQDINLEIKRGEMIAFVGPSGAGKTTLVDLILRLHDPQSGTIQIDGKDIRTLKQSALRKLFGVVSQDTILFNTSIYDNITYGRAHLTEQDVIHAAEVANALEFISDMPEGFQTIVGDRGVRLSGGQRQRLAIARAVAGLPQILVMDEATSALDSESERLVQDAIDKAIQNSTAIIIAHRLSTVKHADRIVVLDQGQIVDIGRHADLLARCELYARLCAHQFASE
jgi:subfamily B ATP-binding cassette protein MsbA